MDQKQELAERLNQANNILVTVSKNPSVDQLASCLGLTIALNKMGKHTTAVFSGAIPSTLEFLQPEKTIEKNTESLRDFIIALDKSKADKLRYKVEDKIVKIFITPYKTSLSEKDLDFSQGDFNVDVVIAIGIQSQADVDEAISSHGRILHDATVATVNTKPGGELGAINWIDSTVSSLSEMIVALINTLDKQLLDGQIATSLLTGIVAETDRFSNEHTTPQTMSISAELMAAGANQQLVVSKLKTGEAVPPQRSENSGGEMGADGVLQITRDEEKPEEQPQGGAEPGTPGEPAAQAAIQAAAPAPDAQPIRLHNEPVEEKREEEGMAISHLDGDRPLLEGVGEPALNPEGAPDKTPEPAMPQINIDEQGKLHNLAYEDTNDNTTDESHQPPSTDPNGRMQSSHMVLQPPSMGGQLTANTQPGGAEPLRDPLSMPPPGTDSGGTLLQRSTFGSPASAMPGDIAGYGGADAELPSGAPAASPFGPSSAGPGTSLPPLAPPEPPAAPQPSVPAPTPLPEPAAPAPGAPPHIDAARDAVNQAINGAPQTTLPPIQALNAQPLGDPLRPLTPPSPAPFPGSPEPPLPPGTPGQSPMGPPPPVPPPMIPPAPQ